jgi:hypothetical protein
LEFRFRAPKGWRTRPPRVVIDFLPSSFHKWPNCGTPVKWR